MHNKTLLLAALLALTTGCIGGPHIDLRHPICLVVKKPADRAQELALYDAMTIGSALWTKHIPVPNVMITNDSDNCSNPPIRVEVKALGPDRCGYAQAFVNHHRITLDPQCVNPIIFAHELGHIIWEYDHIPREARLSVMTPTDPFYPTPKDLEMLCEVHPEITCPEFKWCEGTFFDVYRCPSASPEEGNAKLNQSNSLMPSIKTTSCEI